MKIRRNKVVVTSKKRDHSKIKRPNNFLKNHEFSRLTVKLPKNAPRFSSMSNAVN